MKIGEVITVNHTKLLVLDFIEDNPFVICFTDIKTQFDNKSAFYGNSILSQQTEQWIKNKGFKTIPRTIDLLTMDGYRDKYGTMKVSAAPLTFDEYRKYASILKPHITNWFWTVTAWSNYNNSAYVCGVTDTGNASGSTYTGTYGRLAPAFILDKQSLNHITISFDEESFTVPHVENMQYLVKVLEKAKELESAGPNSFRATSQAKHLLKYLSEEDFLTVTES